MIRGHQPQIRPPTSRDHAATRPSYETVQHPCAELGVNTEIGLNKDMPEFQATATETLQMTVEGRGVTDG